MVPIGCNTGVSYQHDQSDRLFAKKFDSTNFPKNPVLFYLATFCLKKLLWVGTTQMTFCRKSDLITLSKITSSKT
jgi:hypothetical protein